MFFKSKFAVFKLTKKLFKMKKILFILLLFFSANIFAQEDTEIENTTQNISQEENTLFLSEKYPLGEINGIDFDMQIITNILTNEKKGYLYVELFNSSGRLQKIFSNKIEIDEINKFKETLEYINNTFYSTKPTVKTELAYKTKNNILFETYYNKRNIKWDAIIVLDTDYRYSSKKNLYRKHS